MNASDRMTRGELRAAFGLAGIFGLRLFGMFVILPVFAIHARELPGGDNLTLVGLALGAYGLTQAVLQLPYGAWSDRIGRKPALYVGLLIFAAGSMLAGAATDIVWVIVGRALQGAGAISAVAIAMAADLTREEHRTKAMALIGSTIGLSFAVSLVAAPWLNQLIGVPGIFVLTGVLALAAILVVRFVVPDVQERPIDRTAGRSRLLDVFVEPQLLRLNVGVFVLHAVLMAQFVHVPLALVDSGLPAAQHWQVYLAVIVGSMVVVLPALFAAERRGHLKSVFAWSVVAVLASQFLIPYWQASTAWLTLALLVFFIGFNVLEAALPSMVSRVAPSGARGAATGAYSTVQFLGTFAGAAAGGYLLQRHGPAGVYLLGGALTIVWLAVVPGMKVLAIRVLALPEIDSGKASGLTQRLRQLPGVHEAEMQSGARAVRLKVDAARFDERSAMRLIAGET